MRFTHFHNKKTSLYVVFVLGALRFLGYFVFSFRVEMFLLALRFLSFESWLWRIETSEYNKDNSSVGKCLIREIDLFLNLHGCLSIFFNLEIVGVNGL